jgi:hypothetical protein
MLSIATNIAEIIAELESAAAALQKDLIPAVMNPALYKPHLVTIAAAHCMEAGLSNETTEAFVNTITGEGVLAGMEFTATAENGDGNESDKRTLPELIRDWVDEQKIKTSDKDAYAGGRGRSPGEMQSNEVIAQRVEAIYLNNPDIFIGAGNHSKSGLGEFLSNAGPGGGEGSGLTGLPEERLTELLAAILTAWQETMGARVQDAALAEIDKAFGIKL